MPSVLTILATTVYVLMYTTIHKFGVSKIVKVTVKAFMLQKIYISNKSYYK